MTAVSDHISHSWTPAQHLSQAAASLLPHVPALQLTKAVSDHISHPWPPSQHLSQAVPSLLPLVLSLLLMLMLFLSIHQSSPPRLPYQVAFAPLSHIHSEQLGAALFDRCYL